MTTVRSTDLPLSGLRPSLQSLVTEKVVSSRNWMARLRAGDALELYYEAGDPHSQLCAAVARRILPRLKVALHIRLVPAPEASTYPEEARQRRFAATDSARLAPCYGIEPPLALDSVQRAALEAALAAAGSDAEAFLRTEAEALQALRAGRGIPSAAPASAQAVSALLAANATRRQKLGHYLPAMWQYRGEWFWALDRLPFLQSRLQANGAITGNETLADWHPGQLTLPKADPETPVEFWFSFRSPYSYLAAIEILRRRRLRQLPRLQIRPVLPMMMRGLPVPPAKRIYIVRDVKRCADALGIPFGRIHDPLGDGALRLLTAYPHSADVDTQLLYCALGTQSVWAEGLDACRDDTLRSVCERAGTDWNAAQHKLAQGMDTAYAEANREALFAAGLWGVPCFRYGSWVTWGQDRLWMLDRLTVTR